MFKRTPKYVFTAEEIATFILLTAKLNPDNYPSPAMKSLIYKCQSATKDDIINFRVVGN